MFFFYIIEESSVYIAVFLRLPLLFFYVESEKSFMHTPGYEHMAHTYISHSGMRRNTKLFIHLSTSLTN